MGYSAFHEWFPEVAKKETRTVTVLKAEKGGAPAGKYALIEMYCEDKGCDCRRVFLTVISENPKLGGILAVIYWGWEDAKFYQKWLGVEVEEQLDVKGPGLNIGSPQSRWAPALLKLASECLLSDEAYVERIKRHYDMFVKKRDG